MPACVIAHKHELVTDGLMLVLVLVNLVELVVVSGGDGRKEGADVGRRAAAPPHGAAA